MPFDGDLNSFKYPSAAKPPSVAKSSLARSSWRKILNFLREAQPSIEIPMYRQIITEARSLIATEEQWIKGHYQSSDDGRITRYCAVGALREARLRLGASHKDYGHAHALMTKLAMVRMKVTSIEAFNDRASYTEVLRLFDAALRVRARTGLSLFSR